MTLSDLFAAIENTAFSTAVRESGVLFPAIESVHVMALAFVFGTVLLLDLRLLGLASVKEPITRLTNDLLPWTWGAFAVAAITGLMLLSSTPERYFNNLPLRFKFLIMALAFINMLVFHFSTYKQVSQWDKAASPPTAVRVAGGLSVVFWVSIIFLGRWAGFV